MITTLSTTSKLGDIEVEFYDELIINWDRCRDALLVVNYESLSGRTRNIKNLLSAKTQEEVARKVLIKFFKSTELTNEGDRFLSWLLAA